jgi:prepilin-type N-terminal cleavage/methylation domain-containing protein
MRNTLKIFCLNSMKTAKNTIGFTLIEVIVAIVILGIMATMLVTFMNASVTRSAEPVLIAQRGAYLNSIMENMTADFKELMATDESPMATFRSRVGAAGTSQTYYSKNNYPYTVVEQHRISFPSGNSVTEQVDGNGKTLKVTIDYQGLILTALFAE